MQYPLNGRARSSVIVLGRTLVGIVLLLAWYPCAYSAPRADESGTEPGGMRPPVASQTRRDSDLDLPFRVAFPEFLGSLVGNGAQIHRLVTHFEPR